jgi:hypothetical protein
VLAHERLALLDRERFAHADVLAFEDVLALQRQPLARLAVARAHQLVEHGLGLDRRHGVEEDGAQQGQRVAGVLAQGPLDQYRPRRSGSRARPVRVEA